VHVLRRSSAIFALAAAGVTLAAAAGAGPVVKTQVKAGKIVFTSNRSGDYEIHAMNEGCLLASKKEKK